MPFLVGQIGVARREGETVGIALGRHPDDLDGESLVPNHLPDDGELLEILLSEQGDVGADLVEQPRHHRRHAVEMARAGGAVETLAEASGADRDLGAARIHGLDVRRPDEGAAFLLQQLGVGRLPPGVGGKVLMRRELGRIDEDRGDDVARPAPPFRDQRHVAGMERAHGRDEGDNTPVRPQGGYRVPQRFDVTDNLHPLAASDISLATPLRGADGIIKAKKIKARNQGVQMASPHFIVFANEKGGTGKSTTAVHSAVALAAAGRRVAALDLDTRQRTLGRYLDNRAETVKRLGIDLVMPAYETFDADKSETIEAQLDRIAADVEIVVVDTPGRDDPYARAAMIRADTLVTPINDSFVDLDLIGQVDAETYRVRRPSFYAELVWNSRTQRAKTHGASVDWVVLRNRMQHIEARNMRRVGEALGELSRRVGFRVIPGLGERVIYRELFPKGLTLLDLPHLGEVGIAHIAARQELREMIAGFALPQPGETAAPQAAALAG